MTKENFTCVFFEQQVPVAVFSTNVNSKNINRSDHSKKNQVKFSFVETVSLGILGLTWLG